MYAGFAQRVQAPRHVAARGKPALHRFADRKVLVLDGIAEGNADDTLQKLAKAIEQFSRMG